MHLYHISFYNLPLSVRAEWFCMGIHCSCHDFLSDGLLAEECDSCRDHGCYLYERHQHSIKLSIPQNRANLGK